MWFYRMSGLTVTSEIELPIPATIVPEPVQTDVLICKKTVPQDLPNAQVRGPNWVMDEKRLLLHVPGVARFLITEGREIATEPNPAIDERDAIIFLLGSAFGILLHQRGHLVLHASAVAVNGKAVLFCGPSGAGKSTLAAALAKRGYPFVTDDICHIGFTESDRPVVFPDGRMLKLWADALEALELVEQKGEAVRKNFLKYYISPPSELAPQTLAVGAIYILRWSESLEVIHP